MKLQEGLSENGFKGWVKMVLRAEWKWLQGPSENGLKGRVKFVTRAERKCFPGPIENGFKGRVKMVSRDKWKWYQGPSSENCYKGRVKMVWMAEWKWLQGWRKSVGNNLWLEVEKLTMTWRPGLPVQPNQLNMTGGKHYQQKTNKNMSCKMKN